MPQQPYIVGNWKMNGTRALLAEARAIDRAAARQTNVEVAIAPPFTLIQAMGEAVETIAVGAQDVHAKVEGAHTGDISAHMLLDAGASFAIIGHSERRTGHCESDRFIRGKAEAANDAGLGVILCVGETAATRTAGDAMTYVLAQLDGGLPRGPGTAEKLSIAYEPIWAVGTGTTPSVDEIGEIHRAIRAKLNEVYDDAASAIRILYGGSVTSGNAAALLSADEVSGALVGGASLTAEAFLGIIVAATGLHEA